MEYPDFTTAERHLIDLVKLSPQPGESMRMWTYILSGLVISGLAAYFQNTVMMYAALIVVCAFRIQEDREYSRWMPIWKSVIEKYEAGFRDSPPPAEGLK